jgi:hypothetical protein
MGGRDDRLSLGSFDGVESGKRVIEVRDVSDVRAKTPLPDPPDNFPQLFTIGLDNQIDGQASFGFGARAGDAYQRPSRSNQSRRRLAMSPLITSKTRSTPSASSSASLSRSTNSCAPKSSAGCWSVARPMPMTYAPASCASYVTGEPTPPAASWKRTL